MFRLFFSTLLLFISYSSWAKAGIADLLHWGTDKKESSGGYVNSQSAKSDAEGNVYITGSFKGKIDFDPGPGKAFLNSQGDTDIFLAKYDESGNYLFSKSIGSAGRDEGISLSLDGQGYIYLTGNFQHTIDVDPGVGTAYLRATGASDVFYVKMDKQGRYLSAKSMGGNNEDWVTDMSVDHAGNIYLCGFFYGTIYFDPGNPKFSLTSVRLFDKESKELPNAFIVHFDDYGAYQFATSLSGDIRQIQVADNNAGEIFIAGSFSGTVNFLSDSYSRVANLTSEGFQDIFFARYNHWGNFQFARKIGGPLSHDIAYDLIARGGDIYITGMFGGRTSMDWVSKMNVTIDFDPGANTATLRSAGDSDAFIAKYDENGKYIYAKRLGGSGDDKGLQIAVDVFGNVFVIGEFSYSVDFDPGPGKSQFTSNGSNDVFVAKYDGEGYYVFAQTMGTSEWDDALCMAIQQKGVDPLKAIYLVPRFNSATISFSSADQMKLNYPGKDQNTLVKYDGSGKFLFAKPFGRGD